MIVYWSFLIWVALLRFVQKSGSVQIEVNGEVEYRAKWGFIWLTFGIVVLFLGLRSGVADSYTYIRTFNEANTSNFSSISSYVAKNFDDSGLFYGLQALFKAHISSEYYVWFFLLTFLSVFGIVYLLKKHSPDFAMSAYIFIASTMFTWLVNGLRQFFVAVALFACTGFLEKNRYVYYFLVAFFLAGLPWLTPGDSWVLSGVHQSALMMIPIGFLVRGKAWNRKTLLFLGFAMLAVLFTESFTNLLYNTAENTIYSDSLDRLKDDTGSNIFRALIAAVPAVMAFFKRKEMEDTAPPIINICVNMSIITTALYIISTITSGIYMGRLPIYCEIYNLILIPWLVMNPYKKNKKFIIAAVYGLYLIYFVVQMYVQWQGLGYVSDVLNVHIGTVE